jgi:hypothetical protein
MLTSVGREFTLSDRALQERTEMPRIENLMLANHAEAVNGLLYVSGGGWAHHWRGPQNPEAPTVSHVGIGLTILIGWNETNRPYQFSVTMDSADGTEMLRLEGRLESGRPPGEAEGTDLRSAVAINGEVAFPAPGRYLVRATVADDVRTVSFEVHDETSAGAAAGQH